MTNGLIHGAIFEGVDGVEVADEVARIAPHLRAVPVFNLCQPTTSGATGDLPVAA